MKPTQQESGPLEHGRARPLGHPAVPVAARQRRPARARGDRARSAHCRQDHHRPGAVPVQGDRRRLERPQAALALPLAALLAYGLARLGAAGFSELRDAVFAKVAETAGRRVSLRVFSHLFTLSLRYHLERRTGELARVIERGVAAITFLLGIVLFNVGPTLFEFALVIGHPAGMYPWPFALVTFVTIVDVCHLHLSRLGMADRHPARDEPARQRGQRPERRQPAQLRDGQGVHQRGLRARPRSIVPSRCTRRPRSARKPRSRFSTSARPGSSRSASPRS